HRAGEQLLQPRRLAGAGRPGRVVTPSQGKARMSASTHPWRLVLAAAALATTAIASACASGAAPQQAGVAAAPTSTSLVWSDEFETIDTGNWSFETGGHGWGNQELQHYT